MRVKIEKHLPKFQKMDVGDISSALGLIVVCQMYLVCENRTILQQKVESAGLDWSKFLDKRPQSAFLDALQSLEKGGLLRQAQDTFEHITYQICVESLSEDQAKEYPELVINKKAAVRFYKPGRSGKGGIIESDVPEIGESVKQLAIVEQETVRTPEITSAIKRIVKVEADTVSMSQSGGLWFLAPQYFQLIQKIETFVGSLRGSNQFYYFPVGDTDKNRDNIWNSFTFDIRKKMKDLKTNGNAVVELIKNSSADEKIPKGRIETVKKNYAVEKERILCYAELLQQSSEKLLAELQASEKEIMEKIKI